VNRGEGKKGHWWSGKEDAEKAGKALFLKREKNWEGHVMRPSDGGGGGGGLGVKQERVQSTTRRIHKR